MRFIHRQNVASKPEIDLGLALLSALAIPGVPLTQGDIAAWCGCSRSMIYNIEKKALRNLRGRLSDDDLEALGNFLQRDRRTAARSHHSELNATTP